MDVMPEGAPPDPTLPSAKTFRRSFPPSVSVSNWKLEAKQEGKGIQSPWHLLITSTILPSNKKYNKHSASIAYSKPASNMQK